MSATAAAAAVARAVEAIAVASARDPVVFRSRMIRRAAAVLVASLMLADDRHGPRVAAANARRLAGAMAQLQALGVDPREVARAIGAAMVDAGGREASADGQRLLTWARG